MRPGDNYPDRGGRINHIGVHYSAVTGGGAPRIVRDQIGYLLEAGYRVTFLTDHGADVSGLSHERLRIARIERPEAKTLGGFLRRSLHVRRALRDLDLNVLISHSIRHGTRYGLLSLMLPMRQIMVEHAHPPTTLSLLSIGQRLTLKWVLGGTRILCVSKGAAQALSDLLGRPVGHVYNYAPDDALAAQFRDLPRAQNVVALGRFAAEKQFDLLIDAFERVSQVHPAWRLHLYGAGAEEKMLRQRAKESACADRIELFGWTDDTLRKLGMAGIVAQTSRYEGFGLALVEAMAVGAPVVSLDCPFGPSEIIRDGQNGILVSESSAEAFAAALDQLMTAPELRQRLGRAAIEVTDRFSKAAHIAAWRREIERVSGPEAPS
jgi:glycosyltransferase involved in cell wall biosynthesis